MSESPRQPEQGDEHATGQLRGAAQSYKLRTWHHAGIKSINNSSGQHRARQPEHVTTAVFRMPHQKKAGETEGQHTTKCLYYGVKHFIFQLPVREEALSSQDAPKQEDAEG